MLWQTNKEVPLQRKQFPCRQVLIRRKHGQQMLLGPEKNKENIIKTDGQL